MSLPTTPEIARRAVSFCLTLALAGCASLHAYEGAQRPERDLAHIAGDTRFSGALPVTLALRRIDDMDLDLRFSGAFVPAGSYDLLIDCTVTESKHTSRHHLRAEVDAGVKYRLVASTGPGNRACSDVQLVTR